MFKIIIRNNFVENQRIMKKTTHDHFAQSLNRLLKRYRLSNHELSALEQIDASKILSLAYTDTGGFDTQNGTFYSEDRKVNYKLKIDYLAEDSNQKQTLILLPVSIGEEL